MRKDYFIFNRMNSLDCSAILCQVKNENTPKREVCFQTVPGRSGDLLLDQKRWGNVRVHYTCAIVEDFQQNYQALKNGLYLNQGYQRLEDSIHPGEFRIAAFCEAIEPKNARYNQIGQFDLIFSCKPQRFLKSGEYEVRFDEAGVLYNATSFPAKPLITVYGSGAGVVTMGSISVEVKELEGSMILDCDMQNAYCIGANGAPINKNASIYAPVFPDLQPGENSVKWSGGITGLEIVPRWWTL